MKFPNKKISFFSVFIFFLVLVRVFGLDVVAFFHPSEKPNRSCDFQKELKQKKLKGFVLYVDTESLKCSACFSIINDFELIKNKINEFNYSIVIETEKNAYFHRNHITKYINNNFSSSIYTDKDSCLKDIYHTSSGSKLLFFNKNGEMVKIIPYDSNTKAKEFLIFFHKYF